MYRGIDTNAGFTIVEALISVAIMAIMFVPIFLLQANVANSIGRLSREQERVIVAKKFMIDSRLSSDPDAQQITLEKRTTDPQALFIFERAPVAENSSIKKFRGVVREQVTIKWTELGQEKSDRLVEYIFKPEKKKE